MKSVSKEGANITIRYDLGKQLPFRDKINKKVKRAIYCVSHRRPAGGFLDEWHESVWLGGLGYQKKGWGGTPRLTAGFLTIRHKKLLFTTNINPSTKVHIPSKNGFVRETCQPNESYFVS